MKLNSKKKTLTIVIVAVLIAIVLISAIIAVVVSEVKKQEENEARNTIDSISISVTPRTEYYVGDEIDLSKLSVFVYTGYPETSYFVNYPDSELIVTGFDSSVVNDAVVITVSYKEFTTTFTVKVSERPSATPVIESIELVGFNTTYSMATWNESGPSSKDVKIKCIYSNGTEKKVSLKDSMIYGYKKVSAPGTVDLTIKYNDNGNIITKVVTVTITN